MYLCLDYGSRYIGMAATDYEGKIPYRYGVIDQKQEVALEKIKSIVEKDNISTILIGVPIGLKGNVTQQTVLTREFIKKLQAVLPAQVVIKEVDETLTSVEAARQIALEGADKTLEHAQAALIMLTSYLHTL